MLWKKFLLVFSVSASLMLPVPYAAHAQDQTSPVEDQQPEDQQPEEQQPEEQQPEEQQPVAAQFEGAAEDAGLGAGQPAHREPRRFQL